MSNNDSFQFGDITGPYIATLVRDYSMLELECISKVSMQTRDSRPTWASLFTNSLLRLQSKVIRRGHIGQGALNYVETLLMHSKCVRIFPRKEL